MAPPRASAGVAAAIEPLREVLAQPDTVLFVGAGVAAWSGLPTWHVLIEELADFLEARGRPSQLVRRELERADLLQAASFGFDVLTPQERATFLRAATRDGVARPSALHRRLATLGPASFITTNYDKLLERTLAAERPDTSFKVVTNLQLVETASIIQSRARDFVFKPHGDVDASDSIVLTREQYRALRGERRHAFDAFKTLLASRPMLFVGFGLRDPDFLLIKDTLATVYQGAAQDHYALVADVDEDELTYWRNNYGIHLVPYATRPADAEPEARHADLLALLDRLAAPLPARARPAAGSQGDELGTMALLRHARRMAQAGLPRDIEPLPLTGYPRRTPLGAPKVSGETATPFIEGDAITGLRANRERLLLTGAPGAGKTFTVRAAVAALAEDVIDAALADDPAADALRVPAYVDLRDYDGDLWTMVVESFPVGFPLDRLLAEGRIAFFVDGLNEVPARIVEDNSLHGDLIAFLERIGACSAVLVTRFGVEHAALGLPEIELEAIPQEHLRALLQARGLSRSEISEELFALLSRPVFYRFCVEHELWDVRTPHAIYVAVLARLGARFQARFGQPLDLAPLFGRVAYRAVDAGDQLIGVDALAAELDAAGATGVDGHELVNWLLSEEMLVPRLGGHVSFFHHSVVEHLAAYELVRRYREDSQALQACLRGRRWDHVVLLAIGFLEPPERAAFFDGVMRVDAPLGLRALAYLDDGWQRWTSEALERLVDLSQTRSFELTSEVKALRIEEQHEPSLLALGASGGSGSGAAFAKTLELGGRARIRRALDALFEHADDSGWCMQVGFALRRTVELADLDYLLQRIAAQATDEPAGQPAETPRGGLVHGLAGVLGAFSLKQLRERIGPFANASPLVRAGLLDMLRGVGPSEWLSAAAELLETDPDRAAITLCFRVLHSATDPDLSALVPDVVGPALLRAQELRAGGWGLAALTMLTGLSDDWRRWVAARAAAEPPGVRAALLWHAARQPDRFFGMLRRLHEQGADWSSEPLDTMTMLGGVEWTGQERLLTALLRERDAALAASVLNTIRGGRMSEVVRPEVVELGDLRWWVDWLGEQWDEAHRRGPLGAFVAAAAADRLPELLELFAEGGPEERTVLAHHVLARHDRLRLEQLTPEMVDWAVEDLHAEHDSVNMGRSLLASVATEDLVEQRLLPLLADAQEPLRSNLTDVLRRAGDRHRRRYLTDTGDPID